MKPAFYKFFGVLCFCILQLTGLWAQDAETTPAEHQPVKNTFASIFIIDNQTVMVPYKKTLEFDIQHRFGLIENGYEDFWGLYAPSNIRLGFGYVPINKLMVGFGFTKKNLTWDVNAKYAILQQKTNGGTPLSLTYYVNMAMDTRNKDAFANADDLAFDDRLSYFHQLLIARKISDRFSLQVGGSISHFNTIYPSENSDGTLEELENDYFALAVSARYKVSDVTNLLFNFDQPLTTHSSIDTETADETNPKPNLSLGVEFNTSAHQFQIFFTNFNSIIPQVNNAYNTNWGFGSSSFSQWDPEWLIGFNMTRLWSY